MHAENVAIGGLACWRILSTPFANRLVQTRCDRRIRMSVGIARGSLTELGISAQVHQSY